MHAHRAGIGDVKDRKGGSVRPFRKAPSRLAAWIDRALIGKGFMGGRMRARRQSSYFDRAMALSASSARSRASPWSTMGFG